MRDGIVNIPDIPDGLSAGLISVLRAMKEAIDVLQGNHASAPAVRRAVTLSDLSAQSLITPAWKDVVTFTNSWVNYGAGYTTAAWWKDFLGIVRFKGRLKSGTMSASAFTVPAECRPRVECSVAASCFDASGNFGAGVVSIETDGEVKLHGPAGYNVQYWIDGVSYYAGL